MITFMKNQIKSKMLKLRAVYLDDWAYDECVRAAKKSSFSAWAGGVLLNEARVVLAGNAGVVVDCRTWGTSCSCGGHAKATFLNGLTGRYFCASCASRFNSVAPGACVAVEKSPCERRRELRRAIFTMLKELDALDDDANSDDLLAGWRSRGDGDAADGDV